MSRAVAEGLQDKARLCDTCVKSSVPALLELVESSDNASRRKAVIALESLMDNVINHDYVTRSGGIPALISALHSDDQIVSLHAAGTFHALSQNISSSLQMVLEGAVLHMLEVEKSTETWRLSLQALRNIWRQINRQDFRRMLHSVARVSSGSMNGIYTLLTTHLIYTQNF